MKGQQQHFCYNMTKINHLKKTVLLELKMNISYFIIKLAFKCYCFLMLYFFFYIIQLIPCALVFLCTYINKKPHLKFYYMKTFHVISTSNMNFRCRSMEREQRTTSKQQSVRASIPMFLCSTDSKSMNFRSYSLSWPVQVH